MHLHCCIVVGRWKLENWHLYHMVPKRAARNASVRWYDWERVL